MGSIARRVFSLVYGCGLALAAGAGGAEVRLVGIGTLAGTERDQSGLSGLLEDGATPGDLAGGFGCGTAPHRRAG